MARIRFKSDGLPTSSVAYFFPCASVVTRHNNPCSRPPTSLSFRTLHFKFRVLSRDFAVEIRLPKLSLAPHLPLRPASSCKAPPSPAYPPPHALPALLALLSVPLLAADRPNILFIFSDDHALQRDLGLRAARSTTRTDAEHRPHREGGLLFTNSFCANSICGPSRACILTGQAQPRERLPRQRHVPLRRRARRPSRSSCRRPATRRR